MKKIALVLVLFALAGFAFGDTIVVPELSGSANTTFGINLNADVATGFETSAEATVSFTLIDEQSATAAGDDDVYGEITVSGFSLTGDADGVAGSGASVEAKLVLGPVYIVIGSDPDFASDKAVIVEEDNDNAEVSTENADMGITVGLDLGVISVAVKVASSASYNLSGAADPVDASAIGVTVDGEVVIVGDYDEDEVTTTLEAEADYVAWLADNEGAFYLGATTGTAEAFDSNNSANDYVIGADVTINIGEIGSIAASVMYDLPAAVFGASVGVDLEFAPITIGLGFDVLDATYDFGASLGAAIEGVVDATVGFHTYMFEDMDLGVWLDFSGLAEPLTLQLMVGLIDLNVTPVGYEINLDVAYDVTAGLNIYVNGGYGSDEELDLNVGLAAGADLTGIDNTTITLDYISANLNGGADSGTISLAVDLAL